MIFREHALQRQIVRFVAKAVAVPHLFACHDRGAARSDRDHLHEAERGIRAGWPDTELCLPGGKTFRCELKSNGKSIEIGSSQDHLRIRLNQLAHPAAEADSVAAYGEQCLRFGVPLRDNWRVLAQLHDEYAAADIRKQKAAEAEKKAAAAATTDPPLVKPRPKVRRKVSPRTMGRIFAGMKPRPL
jgi:hypothetical protein